MHWPEFIIGHILKINTKSIMDINFDFILSNFTRASLSYLLQCLLFSEKNMAGVEVLIIRDNERNGMGVHLKPKTNLSLTRTLIDELRRIQNSLAEEYYRHPWQKYLYVVWYIDKKQIFSNKSLDFAFIYNAFKSHREHEVDEYIGKIFDVLFLNYIGLALPIINCSILNKNITGLFREFFMLNQVNFLSNQLLHSGEIKDFSIMNDLKSLHFNKNIYDKNSFFYYKTLNLDKMRDIIESIIPNSFSQKQITVIKAYFDAAKLKTLRRLYAMAEH